MSVSDKPLNGRVKLTKCFIRSKGAVTECFISSPSLCLYVSILYETVSKWLDLVI